ncbi:MAG: OB-fold nucleic acid binding domain-containing protein, partial [Pseudomonadota bacterium]
FEAADAAEQGGEPETPLPAMPASEQVIQDYQTTRLSLKDHPLRFLRARYDKASVLTTAAATARAAGDFVQCAGIVLIRQRPGSAKGVFFITIEDETGVANLVVWPRVGAVYRPVLMGARILLVAGRVQRADNVTHIVADRLIDRTDDLYWLSEDAQRSAFNGVLARADHGRAPLPAAGQALRKRLQKLRKDDPLIAALSRADEVRKPIPDDVFYRPRDASGLRTHPRNVRVIPKSRDFH